MRRTMPLLLALLILVTLAIPGDAAMGKIADFAFRDFDTDLTGSEGPFSSDGREDAHFSVTIDGIGAVASVSVRRLSDGFEWSSRKGRGLHGLRVKDASGSDISNADGSLPLLPFLGRLGLELYLPVDPGAKDVEGEYQFTARFVDGSEATGRTRLTLPDTVPPAKGPRKIAKARFLSEGDKKHNRVGPGEKPAPGGKPDRGIELELQGKGEVDAIRVQSVSGRFAAWDTYPSNRKWILGVEHRGKMLNEADGSVSFRIRGTTRLTLWMEDNGAIEGGDTTFQVTVFFSDGKKLTRNVAPAEEETTPSTGKGLTFVGRGKRDVVGTGEGLGSDGKTDWQYRLDLNTRGTIIGLTLLGEGKNAPTWDTLPGNRVPLVAVTNAEGRILNRQNGSLNLPLYGKTTLFLWVDGKEKEPARNKGYRVKAVFDDGRVLEFGPGREKPSDTGAEKKGKIVFRARYLGRQDRDRVSPSETLIGDGLPDNRIRIYLEMPEKGRRLKTLSVRAEKAPFRGWDTTPGNRRWAILVTDSAGDILNGTDGSILLTLGRKTELSLWLGDRGELNRPELDFRVHAVLDDGTSLETRLLR